MSGWENSAAVHKLVGEAGGDPLGIKAENVLTVRRAGILQQTLAHHLAGKKVALGAEKIAADYGKAYGNGSDRSHKLLYGLYPCYNVPHRSENNECCPRHYHKKVSVGV